MSLFIAQAHAQAAPAQAQGADMLQIAFLVALFVLFYFIAIRPQRKRQKEHKDMLGELKIGDEVTTNAGILGKVRKANEDFVVLKVADNVELKFQKFSIQAVLPEGTLKSVNK